jgi:signal transduction histidine kinase
VAFKLSLTAKGLLLVSIPLVVEIGFVGWMTHLQMQAEQETHAALRAEDQANRFNHIALDIYTLWDILDRARTADMRQSARRLAPLYMTQIQPLLNNMRKEYAAMEELTRDNEKTHALVMHSAESLDQMAAGLDDVFAAFHKGDVTAFLQKFAAYRWQVGSTFANLASSDFLLAAQHERENVQASSARQAQIRQHENTLLLIGCAVNAICFLMLAFLFVRNITSRLNILNDNAHRVTVHKALNKQLSGSDEIAQLDQVFHQMVDSLDEASRVRQEFVNMLTHDLRSPLTAIIGTLEIIEDGRAGHLDEHGEKLVKLADRNSERMMRLINDLLDVEKMSSGMLQVTIEDVCLDEVFENVKESTDAWIEEHGIKLAIEDTGLFVKADGEKLERVVFNLVANAIKYSPTGGTISISAREVEKSVEVTVADEGRGIPADQLELIFERFNQAHVGDGKEHGGSGLGLTICRSLIDLLGGRVWATSELGKGSQFHFTLPKA